MAAERLRNAEVQADRLGMPDVQVAVRLRRKARDHRIVPTGLQIRAHDVADEVTLRVFGDDLGCAHAAVLRDLVRGRHAPLRRRRPSLPEMVLCAKSPKADAPRVRPLNRMAALSQFRLYRTCSLERAG